MDNLGIIVSILTVLITGGFLMLLIEHLHVSSSLTDRYYKLMTVFYHKLSNYAKFASFMNGLIEYKNMNGSYVKEFRSLFKPLDTIAHKCIMSGLDLPVTYFSAKELNELNSVNINNIWYYLSEKGQSLGPNLRFDERVANKSDDITKYLYEVSPEYKDLPLNLDLMMKVSGEFFTEIYQPISQSPSMYLYWLDRDKKFKCLILTTISLSLITLSLVLIFGLLLCSWIYISLTIITMLLLLVSVIIFMKIEKKSRGFFR